MRVREAPEGKHVETRSRLLILDAANRSYLEILNAEETK